MTNNSHDRRPDPALIAGIAREVIRRLRESDAESDSQLVAEKLITIDTLDRHAGSGKILASDRAVITPAAREEAKRRGIQIITDIGSVKGHTSKLRQTQTRPDGSEPEANPNALQRQLAHRGISLPACIEVVWTDQPAAEVYRRCMNGRRAVMVDSVSNVQRFASELDPQVWILDRQKLNLVAAVNVAAQIARCPSPASSEKPNSTVGGSR